MPPYRSPLAPFTRRLPGSFLTASVVLGVLLGLVAPAALAQAPNGQAVDSLARFIPHQDLVACWELEGLDAHAAAWKQTAASKLLNDTSLGALLEDLAGQVIEYFQTSSPGMRRIAPADYFGILKQAARQGLAIGIFGKGPDSRGVVIVLRKGNRPEAVRLLEPFAPGRPGEPERKPDPDQVRGRAVHAFDRDGVWWAEGEHLILTGKSSVETILDVVEGKQPGADGHPLRQAVRAAGHGFTPVAYGFADLPALLALPPEAAKVGLDGLKRVEIQWGFRDEALMTALRVVAPAPRHGLLGFLDQPKLDLRSLPPIPAGQTGFAAISLELARAYERSMEMVKASTPTGPDGVEAMENAFRQQFGIDLRADVFAHLGSKHALYVPAPSAPAEGNPLVAMATPYTGLTLSIQVKDQAAVTKALEGIINGMNQILAQRPVGDPPQFRKRGGAGTAYTLEFPPGSAPPGPFGLLSLTVALDREQLIISGTSAAAEKALALVAGPADRRWTPAKEMEAVARTLPPEFVALIVTDPRLTIPVVIENLPFIAQTFNAQVAQARGGRGRGPDFNLQVDPVKLPPADQLRALLFPASTTLAVDDQGIQVLQREAVPSLASPSNVGLLGALLLPARMSARETARRAQCTNNLKQILLAMHNYLSANDRFPRDFADKDGKPLLSWRVAILPYVEQAELYNKFKLDEPWDSPHNKALLKEMPQVFRCPDREKPEPFTTTYRTFTGPGALFEAGQDIGLAAVTDGTSNTIAVAESKDAVPWTKPDDLPFDPEAKPSLYGAGSPHPGGFNCAFADGSVRFLKETVAVQLFKALITRAGGEVVSQDAF